MPKFQQHTGLRFPFLDLKAQFASVREEVMEAVERVFQSQQFILGPEVEALERELAGFVGSRFAIGCASGTDALSLALMACEVGPGDEVITTPFTFVATAGSIARLGARPVFVDIDLETYNIDASKIAPAISHLTKAIIPVHLFGLCADMGPILSIAGQSGIPVIEDAAQAIGSAYAGTSAGNMGAIGCFSFFPSKNLGGAGDGGALTTTDPALAERLFVLRTHGSRNKYEYEMIGTNSRLDALQAAVLRVKLRYLNQWSEKRQQNAQMYRRLFEEHGLSDSVRTPVVPDGRSHIYNQFVISVPRQRDQLKFHLQEDGIPTDIYYPSPLHLQRAFSYLGYTEGDLPLAERASREVLALPIYPELTAEHQEKVVASIAAFYKN